MLMLASGVSALILAGVLSQRHSEPANTTIPPTDEIPRNHPPTSPQVKKSPPVRNTNQPELSELTAPIEAPYLQGSPEIQDWVVIRVAALNTLAWQNDLISLKKILTELRNPLPEIRAGALEATRNFGSRDAIPYLQAIANDSKEPQEKVALYELIEHLKLPTLLEVSEQNKTER